jgi:hypothetical protein
LARPQGHEADSGLGREDFDDGVVAGNDFGRDFRGGDILRRRDFDDVVAGEGN